MDSAKFITPIELMAIISSTSLPKTWHNGKYDKYSGLLMFGVNDISGIIDAVHSIFPWDNIEAFGGPVVPDV